jgi:hypothetical protein
MRVVSWVHLETLWKMKERCSILERSILLDIIIGSLMDWPSEVQLWFLEKMRRKAVDYQFLQKSACAFPKLCPELLQPLFDDVGPGLDAASQALMDLCSSRLPTAVQKRILEQIIFFMGSP